MMLLCTAEGMEEQLEALVQEAKATFGRSSWKKKNAKRSTRSDDRHQRRFGSKRKDGDDNESSVGGGRRRKGRLRRHDTRSESEEEEEHDAVEEAEVRSILDEETLSTTSASTTITTSTNGSIEVSYSFLASTMGRGGGSTASSSRRRTSSMDKFHQSSHRGPPNVEPSAFWANSQVATETKAHTTDVGEEEDEYEEGGISSYEIVTTNEIVDGDFDSGPSLLNTEDTCVERKGLPDCLLYGKYEMEVEVPEVDGTTISGLMSDRTGHSVRAATEDEAEDDDGDDTIDTREMVQDEVEDIEFCDGTSKEAESVPGNDATTSISTFKHSLEEDSCLHSVDLESCDEGLFEKIATERATSAYHSMDSSINWAISLKFNGDILQAGREMETISLTGSKKEKRPNDVMLLPSIPSNDEKREDVGDHCQDKRWAQHPLVVSKEDDEGDDNNQRDIVRQGSIDQIAMVQCQRTYGKGKLALLTGDCSREFLEELLLRLYHYVDVDMDDGADFGRENASTTSTITMEIKKEDPYDGDDEDAHQESLATIKEVSVSQKGQVPGDKGHDDIFRKKTEELEEVMHAKPCIEELATLLLLD